MTRPVLLRELEESSRRHDGAGLEQLAADYKERGLVVVGFPCNQFGHQDPGANTEIEKIGRAHV